MPLRLQSTAPQGHKQGTIALTSSSSGLWSELVTDASQFFADYTESTGAGMFQGGTASGRHEFAGEWTIGFVLDIRTASQGYLYRHTTADSLLLEIDSSQRIRCEVNNTEVLLEPIAGLDALTEEHVLAWASRANPATTGASDARESWIYIVNVDDFFVQRFRFTHAEVSWTAGTHYVGCASAAGALAYNEPIFEYFVDQRCQTLTEIANDWIESWTAPATEAEVERPPLPLARGSGIAEPDEFFGPVAHWASRVASHMKRRTWTPLVNRVFRSQPEIRDISHVGHPAFRFAPGSSQYIMMLGWLQVAPVPPGADRVRVKMHTRQFLLSGSAVTVGIRIYVMSRRPSGEFELAGEGQAPLEKYFTTEESSRNDTASGQGAWVASDILPIPANSDGLIYVCPAYVFDPDDDEVNDLNARLQVRALHVIPMRGNGNGDGGGTIPFGGGALGG
ncbi:MAG: hypothetical protein AAF721_00460 [Myxococcota bacterium]